MDAMTAWWSTLQPLNHWFYTAAAFFSVFFVWQLISAIAGLGGGADVDATVEPSWDHQSPNDSGDSVQVFKLLSIRSVLAFFTLFSWAGALYLNLGLPVARSLVYALLWGLAAMALVSLAFYLLRRMSASGNQQIGECVGQTAAVYLDIPENGEGEVRLMCGGVMTHYKARLPRGQAARAGATVRVVRATGPNSLAVEPTAP